MKIGFGILNEATWPKTLFLTLILGVTAHAQNLNRRAINDFVPASPSVTVAFFDADSTLRVSKSGSVSANGPHDYEILPGIAKQIRSLNQRHILVAIVSNQAGVPRYVSLEDADAALTNMVSDLRLNGAIVNYFDFAENADENRKPETGMALRLEKTLREEFSSEINRQNSFMIGDSAFKRGANGQPAETRPDGRPGFNFSNSDRLFAENYGIRFEEPSTFFGWKKYGVELIENTADLRSLQMRILHSCSSVFP